MAEWQGDAEVDRLLAEGRKIDAIRRIRELTGWGLREAKDEADRRHEELAEQRPRDPLSFAKGDPVTDRLIRDGRRIEAIKRVRDLRGCGLREAKELVEQRQAELERYGGAAPSLLPGAVPGHDPWEDGVLGGDAEDPAAEVRALMGRGQKIEAIKLVRTLYNCGLKEAKDWVEAIERGERPALPGAAARSRDTGLAAEVREMLARADNIGAIKLVHDRLGCGLLRAREWVEAIGRGEDPPAPIPEAPPSSWPGALPAPPASKSTAAPTAAPKPTAAPPAPPPTARPEASPSPAQPPPRSTPLPGSEDSPYQQVEERRPWWKFW